MNSGIVHASSNIIVPFPVSFHSLALTLFNDPRKLRQKTAITGKTIIVPSIRPGVSVGTRDTLSVGYKYLESMALAKTS
jgi:hypothetical protein